jgi:hypothetical protein
MNIQSLQILSCRSIIPCCDHLPVCNERPIYIAFYFIVVTICFYFQCINLTWIHQHVKLVKQSHFPLLSGFWNVSLLLNLTYHSSYHTFKQLYILQPKYALIHSPHSYFTYSYITSMLVFSFFHWLGFHF